MAWMRSPLLCPRKKGLPGQGKNVYAQPFLTSLKQCHQATSNSMDSQDGTGGWKHGLQTKGKSLPIIQDLGLYIRISHLERIKVGRYTKAQPEKQRGTHRVPRLMTTKPWKFPTHKGRLASLLPLIISSSPSSTSSHFAAFLPSRGHHPSYHKTRH